MTSTNDNPQRQRVVPKTFKDSVKDYFNEIFTPTASKKQDFTTPAQKASHREKLRSKIRTLSFSLIIMVMAGVAFFNQNLAGDETRLEANVTRLMRRETNMLGKAKDLVEKTKNKRVEEIREFVAANGEASPKI